MSNVPVPALRVLGPLDGRGGDGAARPGLPAPTVREVIAATVIVVALAALIRLSFTFSGAIFDVFVALVLGTALRPVVDAVAARTGLARRLVAALLYALLLLVLSGILVVAIPALVDQLGSFVGTLPAHVESLRHRLLATPSGVLRRIAQELPELGTAGPVGVATPFGMKDVLVYVGDLPRVAVKVTAILLVGFYWLVDGETTVRTLVLPLDAARREPVRSLVEEAEARVGGFVRGQLTVCGVSVVLATVGYLLLGLSNPVLLGVIFGACGAIPVFGAPLGALPAALVASASGPGLVLGVAVNAAVVHIIQDYVLAPRIMGKHAGVSSFTVLLAISTFGGLLGVAGALLAIPMAAILQMFFDRYIVAAGEEVPAPTARDRFAVLQLKAKELAIDVKKQSRDRETTEEMARIVDEVEAVAADLERTLAAALPAAPEPPAEPAR